MVSLNLLMFGMLAGCGGPNNDTLLDELRVLAMVPDAPEITPMETTTVRTRVVDPLGLGADVLVWTCTPLGETCLEDEAGPDGSTTRLVEVAPLDDGRIETPVTASPALAAIATEEPLPLLLVWALACEPGLCPLIDDVAAGNEVDPTRWADPLSWMDELPSTGTSLALSQVSVSTRGPDTRHLAPTLTATPQATTAAPSGSVVVDTMLVGTFGSEAKIWGYTEGGGFSMTDVRPALTALGSTGVQTGKSSLTWVAPIEADPEVPIYLVLIDDLGGSALWESSLVVE